MENHCTYSKELGMPPCCTHECNGCVWNEDYDDDDDEELEYLEWTKF